MKEKIDNKDIGTNTPEENNAPMFQGYEETIDSDFEPRQIGEENVQKSQATQFIFEALIDTINPLKPLLDACLKETVNLEDYLDFLKNDNPEKWIYKKFIQVHNIKFNNLSTEKIIELRLIDIEGVEEVLAAFETFQSALNKVRNNGFFYPLSLLWDPAENEFVPNVDFWQACDFYYSHFTFTQKQNEILGIFEKIAEQLNELANLNILRPANGIIELNLLSDYFIISKIKATSPFVVDSYLFYKHRLSRYRTKGENLLKKKFSSAELFH
jgi:hypothetical protein